MLLSFVASAFATRAQLATLIWLQLGWSDCQARRYTAPRYTATIELTCNEPFKRRFLVFPDGSYQ